MSQRWPPRSASNHAACGVANHPRSTWRWQRLAPARHALPPESPSHEAAREPAPPSCGSNCDWRPRQWPGEPACTPCPRPLASLPHLVLRGSLCLRRPARSSQSFCCQRRWDAAQGPTSTGLVGAAPAGRAPAGQTGLVVRSLLLRVLRAPATLVTACLKTVVASQILLCNFISVFCPSPSFDGPTGSRHTLKRGPCALCMYSSRCASSHAMQAGLAVCDRLSGCGV